MKGVNKIKDYYLVTIISPVYGLFAGFRNLQWESRKNVLIFIVAIFGSTIILPVESDGYRLNQMVVSHYVDIGFGQWLFELKEILFFSPVPGTKGDIFSHVLSYFIGGILSLPELYVGAVSIIYGYFFIGSMYEIFRTGRGSWRSSFLAWILVIIFVSYRFIDNIQFIRTWTGGWVLFYGTFKYYNTGLKKYLLLMLCAPIFHVAYFLMALPAYAVVLLKSINSKIFVLLYILSFVISINPGGIIEKLKTNELGKNKVNNYYSEDDQAIKKKNSNFYVTYGKNWAKTKAPNILAIVLILFGFFSRSKMNPLEYGVFSTGILLATFANLGDFIPAFYNRTMTNAGIYFTATPVLLLIRGELLYGRGWTLFFRRLMLWISVLIFVPYIIYVAANMLQFTSIFIFFMPIIGFFSELNLSIRDLIGGLL